MTPLEDGSLLGRDPVPPPHATRRTTALLGGLATIALLGLLDYASGPEIGFSIFYLAPISWVTWRVGRWPGLAVAVTAALVWALVDRMSGLDFSHPAIPVWNSLVRLGFFVITARLVADVRRAQLRERDLARRDPVTGVANARAFLESLERELARMRRTGSPLTLAYVDLDHFKVVNDTLGHTAGDELLRDIAGSLAGTLRTVDVVARLGGDEFGLLLPETEAAPARAALQRALEAIRARVRAVEGVPGGVGATIGAVVFRHPPSSAEDAIRAADDRMYAAKRSGRDQLSLVTLREGHHHGEAQAPEASG